MKSSLCALFLLAACNGDRGDATHKRKSTGVGVDVSFDGKVSVPKPTGTPHPQTKLAVTLDGHPVDMATALALPVAGSPGRFKLIVSSVPVGCGDVSGRMRALQAGETTFDVDVLNTGSAGSDASWQLRSIHFSGNTQSYPRPIHATGGPGQPITADVDFEIENSGSTKHVVTAKGTIDALSCPAAP